MAQVYVVAVYTKEGINLRLDLISTIGGHSPTTADFSFYGNSTCRAAVLRLLNDGVGNEMYDRAGDETIKSNPKLSHGIPLVDTIHYLAKEIQNLSELSNAPSRKF